MQTDEVRRTVVETREIALLQEAGIYEYRHPLSDVVAYEKALDRLQDAIKAAVKKDGGAILATTNWEVNGSKAEGQKMVQDFSKLMLRAFNAEADMLVRGLKPYKLDSAKERLGKVEATIKRLGATMQIVISPAYYQLRLDELELTSDYLQKEAEEKEVEREERVRMREERKAQQEIQREREKLEKEKQHFVNALEALEAQGDQEAIQRVQIQLAEVDQAIESVDARAANTRAGYVYVISNIGSFGEKMVKVGLTRRLDPMDRIRELSDASVPFNFDVHALFFSKDAVGIETAMHDRLARYRVNSVNRRREFFHATPLEAKIHLSALAGELLQFRESADAIEYRQTLRIDAQSPAT
jgi:ribosomal protein S26/cytochrome c556